MQSTTKTYDCEYFDCVNRVYPEYVDPYLVAAGKKNLALKILDGFDIETLLVESQEEIHE